jgi:hypothetical protein
MSIHHEDVFCRKSFAFLGAWLVVSGLLLFPGRGIAETVTLSNGGSTASVDLTDGAGMNSWYVLGQNQLMQQWFWYRTDGGIAQPINTIGTPNYTITGGNKLDVFYANDLLSIEIIYRLTGGGDGSADMMENIFAVNLSGSVNTLNLYEYSYFNLLQSGNNSVSIFEDSLNGGYNHVQQTSGSTAIHETIASPNANHAEAAYFDQTLNELNTQSGLVLNDNLMMDEGPVTWSFQWTQTMAPDQEFQIFKDKSLSIQEVPEPGTIALTLLGGLCLAGWTVRRRRS